MNSFGAGDCDGLPSAPPRVLAEHTVVRTASLATAVAAARRNFAQVLDLQPLDRGTPFELHSRNVSIDSVKILAAASSGHRISLVDHGKLSVLMPMVGRIAVDDGRRAVEVGVGGMLVPGLGRRTTTVGAGYDGLVLMVARDRLEARLALDLDRPRADLFDGIGALAADQREVTFLADYLRVVVREVDRHGPIATSERVRRTAALLLTDLFAEVLVARGEAAGTVRRVSSAASWQVERAKAYIRDNATEPLSVADVAAAVGTSPRALQLAFQRHRQVTPRAYLQGFRLELLREKLLVAPPGARVTDLAQDCGIAHLGRGAAAYRRRFGESPSATLTRAQRRH